jgi:glycosyltransferase involved in cell wall biosynthesis
LRILIVNVTLAGRTGTETALRDLALGLKVRGLQPMVYSPELGEIADEIGASGIPLFSRLEDVSDEPDVVHGNHHVQTVEALLRFRHARGLFVCHDRRAHMSAPPRLSRILRYVAVDYNCLERLTEEYGIPRRLTRVIYNSVDTSRFLSRPPLPARPRRALVFSNYAGAGHYLDAVERACALVNLPVEVVGAGAGNSSAAPELFIGEYDLVFAKARCALEAMAVGAAVVLADTPGLGPLVTSAEVAQLRPWNFGARLLREPLDPAGIVRQVERYDADDASAVSQYIREHADVSTALDQYVALYAELMNEPLPSPATVAGELDEYLRYTATRIGEMELELEQYRQPHRMHALPDAACAQLGLSIENCPGTVECGGTAAVRVLIENGSPEEIGSFPPFPVQLSYRWLTDEDERIVGPEALRTPLTTALPPHEKASYVMTIATPGEPGRYRLRVTLVQEFVRWLDDPPFLLSADATLVGVSSLSRARTA